MKWKQSNMSIAVVFGVALATSMLIAACTAQPDGLTAPTPTAAPQASQHSIADGNSCPSDAPQGLAVNQQEGHFNIDWLAVEKLNTYLVWITEDDGRTTPWPLIKGAPSTSVGTHFEIPLSDEYVHAVQVQSYCGGQKGNMSKVVVFGGHGARVEPPPPVVECHKKRRHHGYNSTSSQECRR